MKSKVGKEKHMDQNHNPYQQTPYGVYNKPNYMETASLALGVLSIVTCSCIYGAFIFGGIAIVLALLSRGGKMKLGSKAKLAIILAIVGMIITTVFYTACFYIAIQEYGSLEELLRASCEMAGYDFDALYGDFFQ